MASASTPASRFLSCLNSCPHCLWWTIRCNCEWKNTPAKNQTKTNNNYTTTKTNWFKGQGDNTVGKSTWSISMRAWVQSLRTLVKARAMGGWGRRITVSLGSSLLCTSIPGSQLTLRKSTTQESQEVPETDQMHKTLLPQGYRSKLLRRQFIWTALKRFWDLLSYLQTVQRALGL